jgi:hypothetical protein
MKNTAGVDALFKETRASAVAWNKGAQSLIQAVIQDFAFKAATSDRVLGNFGVLFSDKTSNY